MRWAVRDADEALVRDLSAELNVSAAVARMLALRGFQNAAAARRFIDPSLSLLHDPFLMAGMPAAVQRIHRAIAANEKILIYGDYDVDGTMACVVLLTALKSLGACVDEYVPNRFVDGYGMRAGVIERAAQQGYKLIISVDTGIREHEALGCAKSLGIDCIITDHHLPGPQLPQAFAILNPKRPGCTYPDKQLAGVGVAFKLVQAVLGKNLSERALKSYLKMVAIGSIADLAPLLGENRIFAWHGLAAMADSVNGIYAKAPGRAGLSALLEAAGLRGRVTSDDVAFRLAPRLNAAGRISDARAVVKLFTEASPDAARQTVARLEQMNSDRRRQEEVILSEINAKCEAREEYANRYSLVFSGSGWHRGVIGLAAQRVAERYHRPALVISIEDGVAHGSGRSIPGFHLIDCLSSCAELFSRFGGHAQAAGFSLMSSRLGELETKFERYARSVLLPEQLEPVLHADAEIRIEDVNSQLISELERLEPFGAGNPKPVFFSTAEVCGALRVLKQKHLKFKIKSKQISYDAIGWGLAAKADEITESPVIRLAFSLEKHEFQGIESLQLLIRDVKPLHEAGLSTPTSAGREQQKLPND